MSSPAPPPPDWSSLSPDERSRLVRRWGNELGFDLIGIARAEPLEAPRRALERWLARGFQADMHWLGRDIERRTNPESVLPGCRAVVVVGVNYYSVDSPSDSPSLRSPAADAAPCAADSSPRGRIARYALRGDYHRSLGRHLRALARRLDTAGGGKHPTRWYVDTGPIIEKAWARQAGLGFIGKNTCLIHPRRGSWFVLGVLLTTLELAPDVPLDGECGECRRCLDACPTGALVEPGVLDARRCLSYLTVEHRGEVSPELDEKFREWLFGCDLCQSVCPFNHKHQTPAAPEGILGPMIRAPWISLEAVARLQTKEELRGLFGADSPVRRAGLAGLRRTLRLLLRQLHGPHS